MGIKITRSLFRPGEPFYPAFATIAGQTWGGKSDAELMGLAAILQAGVRDHSAQRDKYIKEFGKPSENGGFSMENASPEDVVEYDSLMEEAYEVEIELPIERPLLLTKRKKNFISPFEAAAVANIIQIEWPNDNGEDLDRVEKK